MSGDGIKRITFWIGASAFFTVASCPHHHKPNCLRRSQSRHWDNQPQRAQHFGLPTASRNSQSRVNRPARSTALPPLGHSQSRQNKPSELHPVAPIADSDAARATRQSSFYPSASALSGQSAPGSFRDNQCQKCSDEQ